MTGSALIFFPMADLPPKLPAPRGIREGAKFPEQQLDKGKNKLDTLFPTGIQGRVTTGSHYPES